MSYDLSNPPVSYDLPVNADGTCMKCKWAPPEPETIPCHTCATPWHVSCLSSPPETVASTLDWLCPDCSGLVTGVTGGGGRDVSVVVSGGSDDLVAKVRAIEADETMDAKEKAKRRQELVSGRAHDSEEEEQDKEKDEEGGEKKEKDVLELLGGSFNCRICFQLPERPITTPCGHNYCLKCFQKWAKESRTCVICRAEIPSKISANPRINSALVTAIRMAKCAKLTSSGSGQVYHFMRNDTRPEKAFTTDRAKRAGKANACSGQIFVTVAPDHFGPIPAENDPKRNRGVLVGDLWEDRLECRQWGAHLPHVAGIAGQSDYGAQSVALSGGYEDDEDHGEWFLYTGSGGRDLSGNKRTNKAQSFDQKFEKLNLALRLSCMKGYPVRVVRSFKEKRSAYAPETGVRYDGVYRIEKCWRKAGIQGYKVCRYLFVRCDNEPAPWTSDEHGDRPRRLPAIEELEGATDVTERTDIPSWDYDEEKGWMWMKPPPKSKKPVRIEDPSEQKETKKAIRLAQNTSVMERLLKEFNCRLCRQVMSLPLSAPCGHNFCKQCLLGSYADQSFVRERVSAGGRTLRAQKIVKNCPVCPTDITEFLKNPQINREIMELIESLKRKCEEGKELNKKRGDDQEDLNEDEVKTEGKPDELNEKKVETLEGDSIRKTSKRAREENALSSPKRTKKEADEKMIDEAVVADTAYSPLSPLSVPVAQDIQVV